LDLGCFHNLSTEGQQRYIAGLQHWMRPGGLYLLYAWQPSSGGASKGLTRETVLAAFEKGFKVVGYEQGQGHPSAWYYFEKQPD
jgi:hypothetical protein